MERLLITCEELGIPLGDEKSVAVYIVTPNYAVRKWGLQQLPKLRDKGIFATMDYMDRSMKAQMKDANRENARFAIIVGEYELKEGRFFFRDKKESEEEAISFGEILERVVRQLN